MSDLKDCKIMLVAVIQAQDARSAQLSLSQAGITSFDLPSVGGFLGRRNITLLISLTAEKKQEAVDLLNETCKERVEFIAVPLESAPLPLPTPTAVQIGGATIFELPIERCEEV